MTRAIITAIEPQLAISERGRALRKPPERLDAWENYQRGLWHVFQYRAEDRDTAMVFLRRAVALDPTFSSAHAGLCIALYVYAILGASTDRAADHEGGPDPAAGAARNFAAQRVFLRYW